MVDACFPQSRVGRLVTIKKADEALCRAEAQGRDRFSGTEAG
jgi:PleD family two-component response regulator